METQAYSLYLNSWVYNWFLKKAINLKWSQRKESRGEFKIFESYLKVTLQQNFISLESLDVGENPQKLLSAI